MRSCHVQDASVRNRPMKKHLAIFRPVAAALLALPLALPAGAMPLRLPDVDTSPVIQVGGDCYALGQRMAGQRGGTLAKATAQNRGGQTVCVIVVLVPGDGYGKRPSRQQFVVPLGGATRNGY